MKTAPVQTTSPATGTILYSRAGVRGVIADGCFTRSDGQGWTLTLPDEAKTLLEVLLADGWRLAG